MIQKVIYKTTTAQNKANYWTKPLRKSGKGIEKVISHRPFSMFITVVVNTSIDRSPCSQRSIRDDFQMGFTRFSQCFRLIYPLLSHHTSIAFVSYKGENHLIVWYKTGSSRIWSDELYISIIRALTKTNKTPYFGQNLRFLIKGMADGLTRASSRPSFVIPFIGAASCTVPTIGR